MVQRKVEIPLAGFIDEIVDGVRGADHGSQTEDMMKIVQTVRDEPDTWSPEAEGEKVLEKDRTVGVGNKWPSGAVFGDCGQWAPARWELPGGPFFDTENGSW